MRAKSQSLLSRIFLANFMMMLLLGACGPSQTQPVTEATPLPPTQPPE